MDQDFVSHALGTVAAISSLATKAHARSHAVIEAQQKALEVAGKQIEANANAAVQWKAEIDRLTNDLRQFKTECADLARQRELAKEQEAKRCAWIVEFMREHKCEYDAAHLAYLEEDT